MGLPSASAMLVLDVLGFVSDIVRTQVGETVKTEKNVPVTCEMATCHVIWFLFVVIPVILNLYNLLKFYTKLQELPREPS
jgi:hypothetical protein